MNVWINMQLNVWAASKAGGKERSPCKERLKHTHTKTYSKATKRIHTQYIG